jgi:hypothetical protein
MAAPVPFSTKVMTKNHTGEDVPLASGQYIDFTTIDDEDIDCTEKRQKLLLDTMKDMGIKERPCMAIDLAPLRELDLILDGKQWVDPEPEEIRPECARIIVPASQLVDIAHLKPAIGESLVRCNPAFPAYRWFQAINLLLHYAGKTPGRVIPFPLQQQAKDDNQPTEMIYHILRVTPAEYQEYQKLLKHAVDNDGVEKGFFHAAKYGYEVLFRRGHTPITSKVVGDHVTSVMLMGQPVIKGVLLCGAKPEDLEELANKHFIYH